MRFKINFNSIVGRSGLYIFISLGAAMVLNVILFIGLSGNQFRNLVETENKDHVQTIVKMFDHEIRHYMQLIQEESRGNTLVNAVMDTDSTEYYLPDYMESLKVSDIPGHFFLLTFDGMVVHSTDSSLSREEELPGFESLLEGGKLVNPILYDEENMFLCIIGEVEYLEYTEGYLIFKTGITDLFESMDFIFESFAQERYFALLYENREIIKEGKIEGEEYLVSLFPLETIPLSIAVGTTVDSINHPIREILLQLILAVSVSLVILSIVFSVIVSRKLTDPLLILHNGIQKAAEGNWETFHIHDSDPDEIQFLRKSFNDMQKSIQMKTSELEDRNMELRKSHESLLKAQKQLVHSEKMASIGQLAAGVAHEINNPTGFVSNNLETMSEYMKIFQMLYMKTKELYENGEEKNLEQIIALMEEENINYIVNDSFLLLGESLDGMNRIKNIVQGLRNFARSNDGEQKKSNVNDAIEDALRLTWNELKYKCKVIKELSEIPEIYCRSDQLTQVFVNLLLNASHAIEDKGVITIRSYIKDRWLLISINDTGSGIEEENIKHLFDPFFTTKEAGKGTGLGLSISYNIITEHNGDIAVNSAPGKGATFTVSLPLKNS